jgi:hypothetical protein
LKNLKDSETLGHVELSNDLTKVERDQEKQLLNKALELQRLSSGEYTFKVRGPPWARRIVKAKPNDR